MLGVLEILACLVSPVGRHVILNLSDQNITKLGRNVWVLGRGADGNHTCLLINGHADAFFDGFENPGLFVSQLVWIQVCITLKLFFLLLEEAHCPAKGLHRERNDSIPPRSLVIFLQILIVVCSDGFLLVLEANLKREKVGKERCRIDYLRIELRSKSVRATGRAEIDAGKAGEGGNVSATRATACTLRGHKSRCAIFVWNAEADYQAYHNCSASPFQKKFPLF